MSGFSLDVSVSNFETPDFSKFLDEVMQQVVVRAQARTPVRTGTLRDSIGAKKVDDSTYAVGSDVEYAGFIEFGTRYISPYLMVTTAIEEIDQIAQTIQIELK
jgi:HK97 gp10 family phage protein